MDLGLSDRVAIVTGGSLGIGRIIAHTFAKEGANVVIASRNTERGTIVAREVKELGGESLLIRTDVSKLRDTEIFGLGDEKKLKKLHSAYPMGRLGTPEDVASLVAFLGSEKAGFITGETICVNGGYCMVS